MEAARIRANKITVTAKKLNINTNNRKKTIALKIGLKIALKIVLKIALKIDLKIDLKGNMCNGRINAQNAQKHSFERIIYTRISGTIRGTSTSVLTVIGHLQIKMHLLCTSVPIRGRHRSSV